MLPVGECLTTIPSGIVGHSRGIAYSPRLRAALSQTASMPGRGMTGTRPGIRFLPALLASTMRYGHDSRSPRPAIPINPGIPNRCARGHTGSRIALPAGSLEFISSNRCARGRTGSSNWTARGQSGIHFVPPRRRATVAPSAREPARCRSVPINPGNAPTTAIMRIVGRIGLTAQTLRHRRAIEFPFLFCSYGTSI